MKYLGLDYGKRKMGLAVGDNESGFAEPLAVIRFNEESAAIQKIFQYVSVERVDKIVLGISEGKTARDTKTFGMRLEKELQLPVLYQDETLTTHEAQELAITAGIKRRKRKTKEDSFAAALILQSYFDNIQKR